MIMKTIIQKLYILCFMALTVFCMYIVWVVTFDHLVEGYKHRKTIIEIKKNQDLQISKKYEESFQKIILEGEKKEKQYLGYRVIEQMNLKGHFHHIDYEMVPDKRSYCVECHGDIPHGEKKEIRAFANMHASFIACETCHVQQDQNNATGVYKWYDRETGEIIPSPVKEGVPPGRYKSKIIPFEIVDGKPERIDSQERIDFSKEYRKNEKTLSDTQKAKAKKIIHKIINEKPHICEDCHRVQDSLLPFEALGYSKKRADMLVSTEVVGMIRDNTKFFIPRMLHPGQSDADSEDIKNP
jgi:hypothetical protein